MKPKKKVIIYPDNKDPNESSEPKQKSNENNKENQKSSFSSTME